MNERDTVEEKPFDAVYARRSITATGAHTGDVPVDVHTLLDIGEIEGKDRFRPDSVKTRARNRSIYPTELPQFSALGGKIKGLGGEKRGSSLDGVFRR